MSDARLRELERAWQQDPGDHDALSRLISGKRRAGQDVPGWMLDQEVHDGRTFEPGYLFDVFADLPVGGVQRLGQTTKAKGIEIPDHYAWWVKPKSVGKALPDIIAAVRAHDVPGLALRAVLIPPQLRLLRDLPFLNWLDLAGCKRVAERALEILSENLPQLRHLNLDGCSHSLQVSDEWLLAMPDLIHLYLRTRCGDQRVEHVVAGAPKLTRLRVGGTDLTNVGLTLLTRLPELTRLEVSDSGRVSAKGLESLSELPRLLHLDLVRCARIKGPSLKVLKKLPHLVSLGYFPVWPYQRLLLRAVTSDDVRGLEKLTQLRHMTLVDVDTDPARLTGAQRRALRARLTECEVAFESFLGHGIWDDR
jgi:hypothetical protein